jgi:membrane-associated phospholipid phosphatase
MQRLSASGPKPPPWFHRTVGLGLTAEKQSSAPLSHFSVESQLTMLLRAIVVLTIYPLSLFGQDQTPQDQTPQDQTAQVAPSPNEEAQPPTDPPAQAEAQDQTPAQAGSQDQTPGQNGQPQPASTQPYERPVSFNPFKFGPSFFSDEAKIWSFPVKAVGTGHHLLPTLAVAGITAGLVFVDPTEGKYFRQHAATFHTFNNVLSEKNTDYAILGTPALFYFGGLISRDHYFMHTGMLAAEAWVDSEVLNMALRAAFARERPADIPVNGNFSDTWFKTSRNPWNSPGSFPSGHTTWAFSIFTVIAHRYSSHKWVPPLLYSLGGIAAFSRLTLSDHFLSDTFFGAVEGYTIARFVVLRQ